MDRSSVESNQLKSQWRVRLLQLRNDSIKYEIKINSCIEYLIVDCWHKGLILLKGKNYEKRRWLRGESSTWLWIIRMMDVEWERVPNFGSSHNKGAVTHVNRCCEGNLKEMLIKLEKREKTLQTSKLSNCSTELLLTPYTVKKNSISIISCTKKKYRKNLCFSILA